MSLREIGYVWISHHSYLNSYTSKLILISHISYLFPYFLLTHSTVCLAFEFPLVFSLKKAILTHFCAAHQSEQPLPEDEEDETDTPIVKHSTHRNKPKTQLYHHCHQQQTLNPLPLTLPRPQPKEKSLNYQMKIQPSATPTKRKSTNHQYHHQWPHKPTSITTQALNHIHNQKSKPINTHVQISNPKLQPTPTTKKKKKPKPTNTANPNSRILRLETQNHEIEEREMNQK